MNRLYINNFVIYRSLNVIFKINSKKINLEIRFRLNEFYQNKSENVRLHVGEDPHDSQKKVNNYTLLSNVTVVKREKTSR